MWVTWLISCLKCWWDKKGDRERKGREMKDLSYRHIWVVKFIATMYELLYLWLRSQTWQKWVGCSNIIPSWSRLPWFIITFHLIPLCERTNPFSHPSGPLEILCSDLLEGDFCSSPFLEDHWPIATFSDYLSIVPFQPLGLKDLSLGWSAREIQGIREEQPLFQLAITKLKTTQHLEV